MADARRVQGFAHLARVHQRILGTGSAQQKLVFLGAVRGEVEQQQVLRRIHRRADAGQRRVQVLRRGARQGVERRLVGVVGQKQHAAGGVHALRGQVAQEQHFVAEHRFGAVAGEAQHEQVRVAGALRPERRDGVLQQRRIGGGAHRSGGGTLAEFFAEREGGQAAGRRHQGQQRQRQRPAHHAAAGSMAAKLSTRRWPCVASPRRGCG